MNRDSAEPQVGAVPGERAREWVEFHHEHARLGVRLGRRRTGHRPVPYRRRRQRPRGLDRPGRRDAARLQQPRILDPFAVEFDTRERCDAVQEAAFESGFLTLGCGYRTIRMLPPLDSTAREMELGAGLLLEAVETVS